MELALGVPCFFPLLRALRAESVDAIRSCEEVFEPQGLTALAIQVITGLWMGRIVLPGFQGAFRPPHPVLVLVYASGVVHGSPFLPPL